VNTWSPSQVLAYRTCPRQWLLRYRTLSPHAKARLVADAPIVMLLGTAAHAGMEAAYRAAKGGMSLSTEQTMGAFADDALDAVRNAWGAFGLDEKEDVSVVEDEVIAVLTSLPRPRPAAILGIEMTLFDVVEGIEFTNVVDLALQTGPTSLHLRDWKRRAYRSLPLTVDLGDDPQLCSYRHAAARHFPWATTVTVGLYSLITNREVHTELPLARAERTMAGEAAMIRRAEADTECVPTPDGTNCDKCRVRPACPRWTVPAGQV
jgi:hypothetical protein